MTEPAYSIARYGGIHTWERVEVPPYRRYERRLGIAFGGLLSFAGLLAVIF